MFAPFLSSLARQPIQQASSLILGKDGDRGSSRNVLFLHRCIQTQTGRSPIGILCIMENNPDTQFFIQSDTKKRELLKNPTKIEEIQKKQFIDRN